MSVDQAGHCERPGSVDHDRPWMPEAKHVFPAANLHNRAIACSYSLGPGIRGIAGPDAARQDDQAGRPFGLQAQGPAGPRRVPGDPDRGSSVTPIELALDLDAEQWTVIGGLGQPAELGAIAPDREITAARRSACPIDGRPPLAQANACPQKHNSEGSPLDRSCHVATSRAQ
jgi:hypothetical protein